MKQKIRVLQSLNSLGIGGNVIFVMNFFRKIDKEKFQVDFVIYDDTKLDFYEEIKKNGSRVYFCKSTKKNRFLKLFDEMMKVKRLLKKEHYDIIHCHSCSFRGIFRGVIPGAMSKGTKVISHSHNPGMPKNNVFDDVVRYVLKVMMSCLVDYGFSCSDVAGQSKYTEKFMRSPNYIQIHNAVQCKNYRWDLKKRKEVRETLGLAKDTFVIGHIGRFEYQKNHTFILELFEEFLKIWSNSKLLLIGGGNLFEEMKEKAEKMGISHAVLFMGRQGSAEMYYQAMDCFVLPSIYEGFPFVLVEAQMNGLRCIVSDRISKSVNISGGVRFVPLEQTASVWATEVLEFGRERMDEGQINKVCELYDLEKETERLQKLYADLVK